jgi:hypothetical protein
MKSLIASLFVVGLSLTATAVPIQLTPHDITALDTYYISKNGTGPGNGNDSASQLYRLNTYFLAAPLDLDASLKPGTQTNIWASGLADWDYAVIHFGASAHGGGGGSVGAWFLNGADSFTFPQAAFSSIDFFRAKRPDVPPPSVPDTGATVALMGLGLGLLVFARRKLA